jgi:hypothetical protein
MRGDVPLSLFTIALCAYFCAQSVNAMLVVRPRIVIIRPNDAHELCEIGRTYSECTFPS